MASPFDDIDAAAQSAIDTVFGETVLVRPMVAGNYAAGPDPARAVRSVRATVSRAPAASSVNYPATNRKAAEAAMDPVEVWIDRAAYAGLGYPLRRGDVIEITEDAERYVVTAAHVGDSGDVRVPLAIGPGA